MNESNPLLTVDFRVPFDRVKAGEVQPAINALLTSSESRLNEIIAEPGPRTYRNTMVALDRMTEGLEYAMNVVRHLESVATYPELRAAYNAVQPSVSAFYSSLVLNEGLWNALRDYAAADEARALTGTRARFVHKTIENFRRHGAELDAKGKARLQEIDVELSTVTTKFSENVLDSTNEFELILSGESDLAGLPPTAVAAARASAAAKGKEGWRFTLQAPSYAPLMMYLDNRLVRHRRGAR
jgi:oligopeptidase A